MLGNSSGANLARTAWTCKGRVPRYKLLRWGARERRLRWPVMAYHVDGLCHVVQLLANASSPRVRRQSSTFVRYTPEACRWSKFGEITIPKVEPGVVHGHHSSKAGRSGAASLPQSGRRRPCPWAAFGRHNEPKQREQIINALLGCSGETSPVQRSA